MYHATIIIIEHLSTLLLLLFYVNIENNMTNSSNYLINIWPVGTYVSWTWFRILYYSLSTVAIIVTTAVSNNFQYNRKIYSISII